MIKKNLLFKIISTSQLRGKIEDQNLFSFFANIRENTHHLSTQKTNKIKTKKTKN